MTSVHQRYDMRIFKKECISLTNAGYNVSIIVADNKGDEFIDGIQILDVGRESNRLKRFAKTLMRIYNKALELNSDVYHFHDPELLLVGLKLKRNGKRVVWDMHENIPASIMQKKYINHLVRVIITFFYRKLEKYTVKNIDGVVCTRESVLYQLYHLNNNVAVVNNFPLINYDPIIPKNRERAICFAGAIVPNYQHKEIIEAISEIENIKYYLAGPVTDSYLHTLKNTPGWDKVDYLGILNFEEVMNLYSKSQIGVVIHKYTHNMDWQIGNFALTKIFEILYWRMPVIATNYSLWQETVFDKYDCGISVNPTNIVQIRYAIETLLNDNERCELLGANGQKAVKTDFNWGYQEKKLLKLYNSLNKS